MMYSSQLRCQSRRARNAKLLRLLGLVGISALLVVGVFIRISPFEKKVGRASCPSHVIAAETGCYQRSL